MLDKLTFEQDEQMRYRQIILDERMEKINNLVNGRGQSFYPFIKDKNGTVSEKKINGFISELTENSNICADGNTAEAYKNFLYYAILGLIWTKNKRCIEASPTVISETFADIIGFAENIENCRYDDYDEFCMEAYRNYRGGGSHMPYFFARMWESLQLLGYAEPFLMWQPRKALLKYCKKYAQENNISVKDNKRYIDEINGWFNDDGVPEQQFDGSAEEMSDGQLKELLAEAFEEDEETKRISKEIDSLGDDDNYEDNAVLSGYSAEETSFFEKKKAEYEMLDTARYWRENIVIDPKRFMDSCENFTRLYFSIDRKKILGDITHMIDVFLYRHRLSAFAFGNAYGLITYQIEKMRDRIETEIERAGKIC